MAENQKGAAPWARANQAFERRWLLYSVLIAACGAAFFGWIWGPPFGVLFFVFYVAMQWQFRRDRGRRGG